jgi:hypothetical protein
MLTYAARMLQVLSELQVTIRERLRRYVNAQAEAIGEGGQRTGSAKSLPAWVGKVPVLVHELIRSYSTPRTCRILVSRDGQVGICESTIYRHTAVYVSSYYYLCVLILLSVSSYYSVYVSSYYYLCPHTAMCLPYYYKCVLILLYVSSFYYICVETRAGAGVR